MKGLFFRGVFLLLILYAVIVQKWDMVAFNGAIFLGTLVLRYLGKRNKEFYTIDNAVAGMFSAAMVFSLFLSWELSFTVVKVDLIFHAVGGAFVGWIGAVYYKSHIKDRLTLYITILLFALAVGSAWEIFEWLFSHAPEIINVPFNPQGMDDTMSDLIADTVGAGTTLAILHFRRHI